MSMISAMSDVAGPGSSKRDGARTSAGIDAGTGTGTKDDIDGPKEVKSKVVDITTPNKTNKTPILVSY